MVLGLRLEGCGSKSAAAVAFSMEAKILEGCVLEVPVHVNEPHVVKNFQSLPL